MTDRLSPAASPGGARTGVRRVNNLPLVITGLALAGFIGIMAMVAVDRARPKDESQVDRPKRGNASALAQRITSPFGGGIIPAKTFAPPELPPAAEDLPRPVPIAPVDLDHPPLPPRLQSPAAPDQDAERIRQLKQSAFEDAVKSPTSGPITARAQGSEAAERTTSDTQAPPTRAKSPATFAQDDRWQWTSRPEAPTTGFVLRTGFVIPAVMISAINSQLAGPVVAQVSQPVYDSATGEQLLIPQGTRLIGVYSNDVAAGQERVFVAWQRLVFPDGQAMDIGELPGTSGAGLSGLAGDVDQHTLRIFGSALLMSLISAGATYSQSAPSVGTANGMGYAPSASGTLSAALGQQLGAAGTAVLMKNLNIAPTITVHAGYRLTVVATKDLTFDHPYRPFSR